MPGERYSNISIPEKLAKACDDYMEDHKELDLRSRAQVVGFALRFLFIETNRVKAKIKKKWKYGRMGS